MRQSEQQLTGNARPAVSFVWFVNFVVETCRSAIHFRAQTQRKKKPTVSHRLEMPF